MSESAPRRRRANPARIALGTLTAVPAGADWDADDAKRAVGWYPAVGWIIGAAATSVPFIARALGWRGKAAAIVGVIILGVLVAMSRMMHFDALADAADGLLGGSTPERRLEIMDDSSIGAFGATMVAFTIAAEGAALTGIVQTTAWYAIMLGTVLSLLGASLALWTIRPARSTGMVAPISGTPAASTVIVALVATGALAGLPFVRVGEDWTSVSLGLAAFAGWPAAQVQGFFACAIVAAIAMLAFPRLLARQVGGITGDLVGASIALTLLLTLATGALFG